MNKKIYKKKKDNFNAVKLSEEEMLGFKSHVNKKSGQEEMLGFALIVIIIAVILVVVLSLALGKDKNREAVESYKVESFANAVLQYTTECEDNFGNILIQDLIFSCVENEKCLNEKDSCLILNSTIKDILDNGYKVGENRLEKGFLLNITINGETLLKFSKGNITNNEKGARVGFSKSGRAAEFVFISYK